MAGFKTLGNSIERLSAQGGEIVDTLHSIEQAVGGAGAAVAHMTILMSEMMKATEGAISRLSELEAQMGKSGTAAGALFDKFDNAKQFVAGLLDAFQSGAMSLLQFRLAAAQAEEQLQKLAGSAGLASSKADELRALAQAIRDTIAAAGSAPPPPNAATGGFSL